MGKLLYEERHVIYDLVELWRTCNEPLDLAKHIDELFNIWGCEIGAGFLKQVYEDLRTDQYSKYAAFSASDFKRFLEDKYSEAKSSRQAQLSEELRAQAKAETEVKRQAQAKAEAEAKLRAQVKAKEREESERRAKAAFDALEKEMVNATTRAELVELGRKRADLAPYTGVSYVYENHCWYCKKSISSAIHAQCSGCRFYICGSCGSCFCP